MNIVELKKIIADFSIGNFEAHLQDQFEFYHSLEIEEAIDNAVFGRYIGNDGLQYFDSHFKYFLSVKEVRSKKVWQLKKLLYPAREALIMYKSNILKADSFIDLYKVVRKAIEIKGLADLFYYDVSIRLGNSKPFESIDFLMPEHIFIQTGAKKGAIALLGKKAIDKISPDEPYLQTELFKEFALLSSMEPYLFEVFLCIKKDELSNLNV